MESPDAEYVAIAARLARGCAGLRNERAALRARMAASPICDIDGYVRDFQALLHRMWDHHVSGAAGRLIAIDPKD